MKNLIITLLFIFSIIYIINDNTQPLFDIDYKSSTNNQRTVYLRGLNSYDIEYINKAKKIIEDNFDLRCVVKEDVKVNYTDINFDCDKAQSELGYTPYKSYDYDEDVVVFITNENLYSVGQKVRGVCYGNQVYIEQYSGFKETVAHELSHSIGLNHCKNQCLMNSKAKVRWDEKKNQPIYCDDCKSKLP